MSFKPYLTVALLLMAAVASLGASGGSAAGGHGDHHAVTYPLPISEYEPVEAERRAELGVEALGVIETLKVRAQREPFNVIASLIFLGAILHTFFASSILKLAHKVEHQHQERIRGDKRIYVEGKQRTSFKATILHLLGEVEAIFGIWLVPLMIALTLSPNHGWGALVGYIDSLTFVEKKYIEPVFVVVIMAIAASRPVIGFAESCLSLVAKLGGRTPAAWWLSILIVAPLLGSFITEPAAMTIAAMLLGQQFYRYNPKGSFKYATISLLFVNVSVGGTLTHFAAPPVLMVANTWNWDIVFMFTNFGWRAFIGIVVASTIYFFIYRKDFTELAARAKATANDGTMPRPEPVPAWIIVVHLLFLAWTVFTLHHPALFIGAFLMFLAFTIATDHHQYAVSIKGPLLVGAFLAGLVTHGGLQGWWIAPVLGALTELPLFLTSTMLTAFNDNAAITFLASQVPAFNIDSAEARALQYAVVAGAVTGGGLTVIANAPNPAGQSLLHRFFDGGVSPLKLLASALLPTVVMILVFMFLPH